MTGFAQRVALITGAANGIGAAVARRIRSGGGEVVLADVDSEKGTALAAEIGAAFVPCDVRDPEATIAAVAEACSRFGGLDIAHLNAGVATGCGLGADFDLAAYRRAMAVNLDGVVFGINAALPALEARGGGDIVVTASLAGLTAVPIDPIYAANKHAVVGLVRSLGPVLAEVGVRINALCPGFAETAIIDDLRGLLAEAGTPIIAVEDVVEAFVRLVEARVSGECWFVQAGRPSEPFVFRNVPGPRAP